MGETMKGETQMTAGLLLLKNRLQPNSSRHLMRHYVNNGVNGAVVFIT